MREYTERSTGLVVKVMNHDEFKQFAQGKIMYHAQSRWVEEWPIHLCCSTFEAKVHKSAWMLDEENKLAEHPLYPSPALQACMERNGEHFSTVTQWRVKYDRKKRQFRVTEIGPPE